MPLPAPETVLRHRGPALLLGPIESFTGSTLRCRSRGAGPWPWPRMLEGAAQTGGLLAGLQPGGLTNTAVTAEYRDLAIHAVSAPGPLRFEARVDRRILHFARSHVTVRDLEGRTLLEGLVALAPDERRPAEDADLLATPPFDPRAGAILAEAGFGPDLFNPGQHRACELVDRYVLQHVIDVAAKLGLAEVLGRRPCTAEDLITAQELSPGLVPGFAPALGWLLARLHAAGLASRAADGVRFPTPLPPPTLAPLRDEIHRLAPSYEPTLDLVEATAAAYLKVARGEATGEHALLRRLGLWARYFSNENGYYALNNRVCGRVAAAQLAETNGTVLELGAGLGGATAAFLEALASTHDLPRLAHYRSTEPVDAFRRRAERTLAAAHPGVPLAFDPLDLNLPWADQDVAPGRLGLVWAVNVFHLARDLDAVLREALAALAAGGWLVVGEGIRPFPDQPVGAEFPFRLLESFVDVRLDPATRPTPGFLTVEHWLGALERAGFEHCRAVPDVARLRDVHPTMYAAAICGRRP